MSLARFPKYSSVESASTVPPKGMESTSAPSAGKALAGGRRMDRRVFPGKEGTPLPRAAVVDKTVAVGSSGANPATAGEGKPFKSEEMTPNPKIPAAAREPYVNSEENK